MTPQKAVRVGLAIAAGVGVLFVCLFGYPLLHWYFTSEIEVVSMRSGLSFGHVTFREAPMMFMFQFGRGAAFFMLGIFLLGSSVFSLVYHWKQLSQTR